LSRSASVRRAPGRVAGGGVTAVLSCEWDQARSASESRFWIGEPTLEKINETMNKDVELFYATRDGQARRIAERIASGLASQEIMTAPYDLGGALPAPSSLAAARLVVLVAAVRYGAPLPEADRFLDAYRLLREPPPLVLLSVNLTARKPGKDTAEGNPYLRKSIARHGLAPVLAQAIAGRLDYSRYGWRDRQLIRFIMMLTGGPTDPTACVDYTRWEVVDEIALRIAAEHQRLSGRVSTSVDLDQHRFYHGQ
jgi:menaquinone-dependent protoporphyrinogen oxidase